MRRHRNRRRKRQGKIIVITTVCLLLVMTAGYAAFQTNLNINVKGNIKEKSRVIQSWTNSSNEDFHSSYYKENIVTATFLDNIDIPDAATESWNVSEDKEHGGVMAWVVPNSEDSTKYDLYIGANKGVIANEDSSYLFSYFVGLMEINFNNNFDTSNVTNMAGMFYNCISITNIDLSSFDTINVIYMNAMFSMWDYRQLKTNLLEINLTGWNTSNVINMRDMFAYNSNLTTIIGIESFDTSNVVNMHGMFSNTAIKSLDLHNFNTEKVTDISYMFGGNINLLELNLCLFNTTNVINMDYLFQGTPALEKIYVGNNWITDNATTIDMFKKSGVSSVTYGQC